MTLSSADSRTAPIGSALHPLLEQLFAAWERDSLSWCVLRLPANTFAPDSDIDLLIDSADLEAATVTAEHHGFVRLPGRRHGVHLVTYDPQRSIWLWLHCVCELSFGPDQSVRAEATSSLLARRLSGPPPQLSQNDEFWITLAHCLLDRQKVATKHRERLARLANQSTADSVTALGLKGLLPNGVESNDLLLAARLGDWDTVERLIPGLIQAASRQGRPDLLHRVARRGGGLLSEVRQVWRSRGISVALLGPDGAGKSTLSSGIEHSFVFPVRQVYMGLTGGMLRHVDRVRVPGVVRVGRLAVIWYRYLLAQYHVARGRVVVFDRYIYDADVPTPRPLSLLARAGRWIDGRCCPAPDLIFLLDAPGEVMHQRKPSYTPEMIENWRQHFLKLRQRLPRIQVIDSTRSVGEVRTHATVLMWQEYVGRWARLNEHRDRSPSS
jgi:thymidylate kinase